MTVIEGKQRDRKTQGNCGQWNTDTVSYADLVTLPNKFVSHDRSGDS